MIYSGITAPTVDQSTVMTGTGTQIGTSAFNTINNDNMYVGYMYTSGEVHGYGTSSTLKSALDNWFTNNLSSFSSKISDSIFCNDRSPYFINESGVSSGGGTGSTVTNYGSFVRLSKNKLSQYSCPLKSDSFTVNDSTNGNALLSQPIGLITADEIFMAGGLCDTDNSSYYLYSSSDYYSMSPDLYNFAMAYMYYLNSNGSLVGGTVDNSYGIRPVISLVSSTLVTGTGTYDDPYIPGELIQEQVIDSSTTTNEVSNPKTGEKLAIILIISILILLTPIIIVLNRKKIINKI